MSASILRRYICQNLVCRKETEVGCAFHEKGAIPQCSCGGKMKRVYSKPGLRRLSKAEIADLSARGVFVSLDPYAKSAEDRDWIGADLSS